MGWNKKTYNRQQVNKKFLSLQIDNHPNREKHNAQSLTELSKASCAI
jgi:hypothetical protein